MSPVLEQPIRAQAATASRAIVASPDVASLRAWPKPVSDSRALPRAASRLLNVVIAALALAVLWPVMLIIAVLVKLSSPGPIIYTQTRVGIDRRSPGTGGGNSRRKIDYGGRLFRIYKFRTMRADPNAELQIWASPNDKRVTAVGRFLRTYRLDELPQLINVLKGDMNVVGPRPEQPKIFLDLHGQIGGYARRQRTLPGITGLAQINQHYDRNIDDVKRKLAFDLDYIDRQAPLTDLAILFRTIPVVLWKRGAW